MNITSMLLSYIFFGISIVALCFSLYFKLLVIKTSPDSRSRDKIIGDMKDPLTWREKNNNMAYICIFWALVSLAFFIYLKFFYTAGLISILYIFIYIAVIAVSISVVGTKKKTII